MLSLSPHGGTGSAFFGKGSRVGFIRLALAMAVLFGHVGERFPFFVWGTQAVEIFFLISGYYMALTFTANYDHSAKGIASFFASRVLRLFPFYYFMILIAWLFWLALPAGSYNAYGAFHYFVGNPSIANRIVAWTLVGQDIISIDNSHHVHLPLRTSWSISAEMMFYLTLPLLLLLRLRVLVALTLALFSLKMAMLHLFDWPAAYYPFPCQMVFFCLGVIAFHCRAALISSRKVAIAAFSLVMLSIACPVPNFESYAIFSVLQILGIALAVPTIQKNLSFRFDRMAGDLSYGVYLSHIVFADLAVTNINSLVSAKLAAVIFASLGIAFLFEVMVQKRIDVFRRTKFYTRAHHTAPAAAAEAGPQKSPAREAPRAGLQVEEV